MYYLQKSLHLFLLIFKVKYCDHLIIKFYRVGASGKSEVKNDTTKVRKNANAKIHGLLLVLFSFSAGVDV